MPGPSSRLEHGQHLLAHAHARVGGVGVVRVGPRLEAGVGAGLHGGRAPDAEQRPAVATGRGGHALQAGGAASAGEAEQHGLGLVVEGVAEQHELGAGSTVVWRSSTAYRAARAAASGPPSVPTSTRDDGHRVEAQLPRLVGRARGHGIRTVLQAVIDDHRAGPPSGSRRLERGRRGERERVGAAAQRDERERGVVARREHGADRAPHVGDRGGEAGSARRRALGHQLTLLQQSPRLGAQRHGRLPRRHRDPQREPQQVRSRPRDRPRLPRPRALHGVRRTRPTTATSRTRSATTATRSTCSCCSTTRCSRASA